MAYNYFRLTLLWRVILLTASILGLVILLFYTRWYVTALCLTAIIAAQFSGLIFYVEKTNRELSRFLDSIKHSDFTQHFVSGSHGNSSFRSLNSAFNEVMQAFQKIKAEKEAHYHYLQSVVEHIPIGILSFDETGEVRLCNKTTKELLHLPHLKTIHALDRISPDLCQIVQGMEAGDRRLVTLQRQSGTEMLTMRATSLMLQGEQVKIVSLQNIRSEMEEQELEAWQKLIRVLTHEIMNSVTPVISLSSTLRGMVASELAAYDPAAPVAMDMDTLQDIEVGLTTIEKRGKGMLHFVENYRKLTRVPKPHLQDVEVAELFHRTESLLRTDLSTQNVQLVMNEPSRDLHIQADPELVEQVLINLIKNATEACRDCLSPKVEVEAFRDPAENNRLSITVRDNGPGIPPEIMDKIFVPFYTTKKQGSGIGLSLSRQIMGLHRGRIKVQTQPGEGTVFTLVF